MTHLEKVAAETAAYKREKAKGDWYEAYVELHETYAWYWFGKGEAMPPMLSREHGRGCMPGDKETDL